MTFDEDLDLAEAVDADLVATFGPRRASACGTEVMDVADPACGGTRREQRAAYLYPIVAPDDHAYRCIDCGSYFERGLGCVECLEPTCVTCVRQEKHACVESLTDERTLTLVGAAQKVSRERIRQIENGALAKLRSSLVVREIGRGAPLRCTRCSLALGHAGTCLPRLPSPAHDLLVRRNTVVRSEKRRRQLKKLAKEENEHIASVQYKIRHYGRLYDVSQLRGLIADAHERLASIQRELDHELKRVAAIEDALNRERTLAIEGP